MAAAAGEISVEVVGGEIVVAKLGGKITVLKRALEDRLTAAYGVTPLIQPRFSTRTGMDFAAGTWLPSAWCHRGSRGLHSG